jgi:hypothetical protein
VALGDGSLVARDLALAAADNLAKLVSGEQPIAFSIIALADDQEQADAIAEAVAEHLVAEHERAAQMAISDVGALDSARGL